MDRIGPGFPGGLNDPLHSQVGLGRRRRANAHGFVAVPDMKRLTVSFAVYSHGFDAHLTGASHDSQSDLTAVGYKDFVDFTHGEAENAMLTIIWSVAKCEEQALL